MRPLRCRLGRHVWQVRRNPEVAGAGAVYRICRRCGREDTTYDTSGHPVIDSGG